MPVTLEASHVSHFATSLVGTGVSASSRRSVISWGGVMSNSEHSVMKRGRCTSNISV